MAAQQSVQEYESSTTKSKESEQQSDFYDYLADRVVDYLNDAKEYRSATTVMGKSIDEWHTLLDNAYNKIHEQCEIQELPMMVSYFGLAQIKVNSATSMMRDMLANSMDAPFAIEPTPIVELPKDKADFGFNKVKLQFVQRLLDNGLPADAIMVNGVIRPEVQKVITKMAAEAKEVLRREENAIASEASGKMTTLLKDQLLDAKFDIAFSEFLFDLNLKPYAVLSYENESRIVQKWKGNKYVREIEVKPTLRRVAPENAYFAKNSTSAQDGAFFIEVAERTRAEINSLRSSGKEAGYIDDAIECVLDDTGTADWLNEIDTDDIIPFSNDTDTIKVLRCQMQISADELEDYTFDVEQEKNIKPKDNADFYNVDVEVVKGRVIKCRVMPYPMGDRTYFSASYKRVSGNPFGISPAMMVYDRQLRVNRLQYAMGLNASVSAAPLLEISSGHFSHPEDVQFKPMHCVFTDPQSSEKVGTGIYQHHITPMFNILFTQMVNEIRLADDECGIPAFLNGNAGLQGAGQTLGGMALMQKSAIMGINDAVYNIDNYVIEPLISLMYAVNMKYEKDDSIKADAKVKAMGVFGLKREMEKAQALAGVLPSMAGYAQRGVIPAQLEKDTVRDYYGQLGLDVERFMPNSGAQMELENAVASRPVTSAPALDGRSGAAAGLV